MAVAWYTLVKVRPLARFRGNDGALGCAGYGRWPLDSRFGMPVAGCVLVKVRSLDSRFRGNDGTKLRW